MKKSLRILFVLGFAVAPAYGNDAISGEGLLQFQNVRGTQGSRPGTFSR